MRWRLSAAAACVILAAGVEKARAGNKTWEPPAGERPAAKALDAQTAKALDEAVLRHGLGQFWGSVVVAKEGTPLLAKGYGLADDSLRPIDADSLLDIGSISKQFTAAAILRLEMDGKLSLDDTLAKFFPECGERAKRITIKRLLTHTSGLSDEHGAIQSLDFPDRDRAVKLAMQSMPNGKPGEMFEYCNGGYCVLAAVVEKASGEKFEDYIRKMIFKPAGMASTGFLDGEGLDLSHGTARTVEGHGPARRMKTLQDGWGWGLRGCGGVMTTAMDLVKWDRALAGEAVLSEEAKTKLYTTEKEGYALGWYVERTVRGTRRIWHSGGTRGYRAVLVRYIEDGVVLGVMTNERNDPIELEKALERVLFPEDQPTLRATLHVGSVKLAEHGGADIDGGLGGLAWRVERKDGRVLARVEQTTDGTTAAVAEISMNEAAASKLAADLSNQIEAKRSAEDKGAAGIAAMMGTKPYARKGNDIVLPERIAAVVLPRYVGSDGTRRIVDERVTLVLQDDAEGFWPLIVKMDLPAAEGLVRDLTTDKSPPLAPAKKK